MNNRVLDKKLKQYYKEIDSLLLCDKAQKKKAIENLKNSVNNFVAENPDCTAEDIFNRFGTAQEIAESFAFDVNPKNIKNKISIKKAVIIALSLIVAIVFCFYGFFLIKEMLDQSGYYVDEIVVYDGESFTGTTY